MSINPIKLSTNLQAKPSMMPIATPSNGNHNLMPAALNLKAGEVPSSCQTMPLNLHAISSLASIQPPLNGLKNGLKGYNRLANCSLPLSSVYKTFNLNETTNSKETKSNKSSSPVIMSSVPACITPTQVSTTTQSIKMDPNEPPTKLIKLINGSAILAPMDKDNKMLHSGQLTLQQVMVIRLFEAWWNF